MSQTDLKYVVGYSSVSHMGYVMLGPRHRQPVSLTGAVFQMFAHGIMTGLFFALIGYVYEKAHTREIADISGPHAAHAARRRLLRDRGARRAWACPRPPGFVAELLVYVGMVIKSVWLAAAAFVGVVVTAAYLLRMLSQRSCSASRPKRSRHLTTLRPLRFAPMAILAAHDHGRRPAARRPCTTRSPSASCRCSRS